MKITCMKLVRRISAFFTLGAAGAMNMSKMQTLHLFSGVGGGLLGDLILGHNPIIAVELDRYACAVLRERAKDGWFPDLQVWEGDVRLFDPSEYAERVDCIHAGFPCQDISNAGKQAGLGEGTRSGLYREVLRIVRVVNEIRAERGLKPVTIFMENVSAILGNGLGTVLGDLASMGYDARWCCLKASDVGANHHRDRWWLLATCKHAQRNVSNSNNCGYKNGQVEIYSTDARFDALSQSSSSCADVAYSNSTQFEGTKQSIGSIEEHSDTSAYGWWQIEPNVDRVANELPFRMDRLKGIGNAQVPLQAATAWKLLGGG
jgi:DNA (cytosine-5)-methyltransferase 1